MARLSNSFDLFAKLQMEDGQYHVVVVGGGPVGLATAYESAKAGKTVLLLEQFNLYNQAGSSGDLVRMFQTMYTGG